VGGERQRREAGDDETGEDAPPARARTLETRGVRARGHEHAHEGDEPERDGQRAVRRYARRLGPERARTRHRRRAGSRRRRDGGDATTVGHLGRRRAKHPPTPATNAPRARPGRRASSREDALGARRRNGDPRRHRRATAGHAVRLGVLAASLLAVLGALAGAFVAGVGGCFARRRPRCPTVVASPPSRRSSRARSPSMTRSRSSRAPSGRAYLRTARCPSRSGSSPSWRVRGHARVRRVSRAFALGRAARPRPSRRRRPRGAGARRHRREPSRPAAALSVVSRHARAADGRVRLRRRGLFAASRARRPRSLAPVVGALTVAGPASASRSSRSPTVPRPSLRGPRAYGADEPRAARGRRRWSAARPAPRVRSRGAGAASAA